MTDDREAPTLAEKLNALCDEVQDVGGRQYDWQKSQTVAGLYGDVTAHVARIAQERDEARSFTELRRNRIVALERENCEYEARVADLTRQVAALTEDRERLDWAQTHPEQAHAAIDRHWEPGFCEDFFNFRYYWDAARRGEPR